MVLRTTLISLLAFAICQIGYGQIGTSARTHATAPPRALRLASNQPTAQPTAPIPAPPVNGPQTNGGTPSTNHGTPAMNYGMETMPAESFPPETTCDDGSCTPCGTNYVPWWHRCFVWSYWKCHGLPSPWCSPGNLSGHIPCNPCMGTYYYFRPYNWFHIPDHQHEAANYNGDPRNPYDNRVVFDGLYDGLE